MNVPLCDEGSESGPENWTMRKKSGSDDSCSGGVNKNDCVAAKIVSVAQCCYINRRRNKLKNIQIDLFPNRIIFTFNNVRLINLF